MTHRPYLRETRTILPDDEVIVVDVYDHPLAVVIDLVNVIGVIVSVVLVVASFALTVGVVVVDIVFVVFITFFRLTLAVLDPSPRQLTSRLSSCSTLASRAVD